MKPTAKYFTACRTGNLKTLKDLLEKGVSADATDEYNLTGLIYAGRKGQIEAAKLLIHHGASLDLGDNRNRTPLFHAMTFNKADFVEYIHNQGASLTIKDAHGYTAPEFARATPLKYSQVIKVFDKIQGLSTNLKPKPETIGLPMSSGPHCGGINKMKVSLFQLFKKYCSTTYCDDLDCFSIQLSVSSKLHDYGEERVYNVRHNKKRNYISSEIVIPIGRWDGVPAEEIKNYLSSKVLNALELSIERAIKNKLKIDKDKLLNDVNIAIKEFNLLSFSNEKNDDNFTNNVLSFIEKFKNSQNPA